jgi:hypothetical protein
MGIFHDLFEVSLPKLKYRINSKVFHSQLNEIPEMASSVRYNTQSVGVARQSVPSVASKCKTRVLFAHVPVLSVAINVVWLTVPHARHAFPGDKALYS